MSDGDEALKSVVAENNRAGERVSIQARALFVFIGADPNTEWHPRSAREPCRSGRSNYLMT